MRGLVVSSATCLVAAFALTLPLERSAAAADPVLFDLGGGTQFPVSVGAEATVQLPYRVLLQADLGWMPRPYSDAIVGVMGDLGVLGATETNLLELAIQNSLVARIAGGWRPFPALGLEVLVGYVLVSVGGGVSGSDVVAAYLQSKGSPDTVPADAGRDVPISTTMHSFEATIAWRFPLASDRLVLRPSLSYLQCLASSTGLQVAAPRPAEQAAVARINAEIDGTLNGYYTQYVKLPVVGLTAAYRF